MEGPILADALTLRDLVGVGQRDTYVTVFAPSGASTLSWTAAQDLHLLGIISSSANGTLYVVALTQIVQPGVFIGMRQIQPKSSAGNLWYNLMNIPVKRGEIIFYNDTVASTTQVIFSWDGL